MSRWRRFPLIVDPVAVMVVMLCNAACATERKTPTAIVTDSAGIRIVTSTAPVWQEGPDWRIGDRPTLILGVLEGDPAFEF